MPSDSSTFSVIFLSLYLAFGPAIFWIWFYFQKGRAGKESSRLLALLFVAGMLVTAIAAAIEFIPNLIFPTEFFACISGFCDVSNPIAVGSLALLMLLIVAPAEELFKYLALRLIAFKHRSFNQVVDGIKYGVAVALGFATAENAFYLISALATADFDKLVSTLILRFFLSTLAHTLYTGIIGYYLGLARFDPLNKNHYIFIGLFYAIVVHGLFNFLLFTNLGIFAILLLVLAGGFLYLQYRERKNLEIQAIKRGEPALPFGIKKEEIEKAEPQIKTLEEIRKERKEEQERRMAEEFRFRQQQNIPRKRIDLGEQDDPNSKNR